MAQKSGQVVVCNSNPYDILAKTYDRGDTVQWWAYMSATIHPWSCNLLAATNGLFDKTKVYTFYIHVSNDGGWHWATHGYGESVAAGQCYVWNGRLLDLTCEGYENYCWSHVLEWFLERAIKGLTEQQQDWLSKK